MTFVAALFKRGNYGCVRKNAVNGDVQNKAHKFHFQRHKDAQIEPQKLYKLLYFITRSRSALQEEQVERLVSIKAVKLWLLQSFQAALQE